MAALLIVVAWNMSEAPKSMHLLRHAPVRDIAVFATCLILTVFVDMVIAITVGVLLACILFVNEMAASMATMDGTVLYMDGVTLLDAGGIAAMNKLVAYCAREGKQIVFCDLQFQPLKTLARADVKPVAGVTRFFSTLDEALTQLA